MSKKIRIKLNYPGFRELLKSDEVASALEGRMAATLSAAESAAPVESGDYKASLRMWTQQNPSRVVVRVGSDADHALFVEANHGILSRALDAAGGRRDR